MKKFSLLLLTLVVCFFTACHKDIWAELENLDQRVTKLEELCKEMNTNITSLQTIVSVLQSNDFITGIVEIKKNGEVIGYTITFGKHDPITIYHGQDGKDGQNGQNGADGKDGSTPVIGVAQDTDGVYYWTLNGEWLLDDNGNKLPVSGKDGQDGTNGSNGQDGADGKDGQDGEDGKDGIDGQDGKDGITPQLKIEDGYWYISYDNGATWTQLGKATGEDGKDGADGQDGSKGDKGDKGDTGDSIFQSVTEDDDYVYFTLSDGTIIKVPKGSGNQSSMGDGYVTSGKADGYYYVDLDLPSGTKWATCNVGSNRPEGPGYFFVWGKTIRVGKTDTTTSIPPEDIHHTLYDAATINWGSNWAIPTREQMKELVDYASWTFTALNDVEGWKVSGPNGNAIFLPITSDSYNFSVIYSLKYSSSTGGGEMYSTKTVYCLTDQTSDRERVKPYVSNCLSNQPAHLLSRYQSYPIRPVLYKQ